MTTIIQGSQLRKLLYGTAVSNAAGKTVPQNATSTIFTVTGGRVLVTGLYGKVTTIIAGTTPSAKIVSTPTVGTAVDVSSATAITGKEVGALLALAGHGRYGAERAERGRWRGTPVAGPVIPVGTLGVNVSAADATGAIQWTLTYVPLDDGATVTAA
jgi:hypothetical protein